MIRSMTGYGMAEQACDGVSWSLELRSLNNRYLKAAIRLPEPFQFLEAEVDKLLRTRVNRGSLTYLLRVRDDSPDAAVPMNRAALQSYLAQVQQVTPPPGVQVVVDLATLAALPGVCQAPALDDSTKDAAWETIAGLTNRALDELIAMRRREGESLRSDLLGQCRAIREHLQVIAERAPVVVDEYRIKLQERVNNLLRSAELTLQEDSLVREVALFADRCDVNEEIARLSCHLEHFVQACDSPEPAGRKLDFLAQEILRETNTIGSKSNDAEITRHVVDIKSLVDRLKEQVQNVE